jgi:spore coat polysaccharide biosynthesis predicted glycosyltransferase SpsG
MTAVHLVTTAGSDDGRGHLSRAISMAEALTGSTVRVSLELLRGEASPGQTDRLAELGVSTGPPPGDAVVLVDLPDPNEVADRWPRELLAAFDDRELLRGRAAIVIQPSLASWNGSAEPGQVLAGYAYAPIRTTLRRLAAERPAETTPPAVVVCFGGSDPADVSARVVPAIVAAGSWPTVAIVGPGYRGRLPMTGGDGQGQVASFRVLRDPADLDRRLATATVVVAGAGTMKFELALLGRPTILVAVAPDQLPIGPPFAATGAARFLGDGRTIEPAAVGEAVAALMADEPARLAMASHGRQVVDGRGADRIAAAVMELARS